MSERLKQIVDDLQKEAIKDFGMGVDVQIMGIVEQIGKLEKRIEYMEKMLKEIEQVRQITTEEKIKIHNVLLHAIGALDDARKELI